MSFHCCHRCSPVLRIVPMSHRRQIFAVQDESGLLFSRACCGIGTAQRRVPDSRLVPLIPGDRGEGEGKSQFICCVPLSEGRA